MIKSVVFVQSVPLPFSGKRMDRFDAPEWEIHEGERAITLHRPASQNVDAIPHFDVVGVGYSITADPKARALAAMSRASMLGPDFYDIGGDAALHREADRLMRDRGKHEPNGSDGGAGGSDGQASSGEVSPPQGGGERAEAYAGKAPDAARESDRGDAEGPRPPRVSDLWADRAGAPSTPEQAQGDAPQAPNRLRKGRRS